MPAPLRLPLSFLWSLCSSSRSLWFVLPFCVVLPLGCDGEQTAPAPVEQPPEAHSGASSEYPGQKYTVELGGVRFELIDPQAPLLPPPDAQLAPPAAARYSGKYGQVQLWLVDATLWVNGQAQGQVAEGDRVRIANRQGQLAVEKNPAMP